MIYIISLLVFSGIIFVLIGLLLILESALIGSEERRIVVNNDEETSLGIKGKHTLLSALGSNGILLPSACGGGGSCGMCKCIVNEGGGNVLPTEITHLSRKEQKDNVRLACQLKVKNDLKIEIPESVFSIKKYSATIVSNKNVATFIKELIIKIDPPEKMNFIAGNYVQIDIPEYEVQFKNYDIDDIYLDDWKKQNLLKIKAKGEEEGFRAYSLANAPFEEDILMLTVRIAAPPFDKPDAPPGFGSSYLFGLKTGDKITVSGPYGDFFVKDTRREMCFVGGGAGMAPMRSHILDQLLCVKTNRKISFWYGARSKKEIFYNEDFKKLNNDFSNFTYNVALSEPLKDDNWNGKTGFIHQCLLDDYLNDHDDPSEIEYYLCGPGPMIDAVISMLDDLGVEEEMIFYDKF